MARSNVVMTLSLLKINYPAIYNVHRAPKKYALYTLHSSDALVYILEVPDLAERNLA